MSSPPPSAPPSEPPPAKVTLRRLGTEGEPLVIIDDFSGQVEELRKRGQQAEYQDGGGAYPGIRAWCGADYLNARRPLMMQIMQQVFGFRKGIRCDASTFSLVTTRPEDLLPPQRIPHYDHAQNQLIAIMHYLDGPASGGTAFYRHRRTGFETISPEREAAYDRALAEDAREYGMPAAGYHYGTNERFELIDEVEAQPDRMVLYRGRVLHSGVIPNPAALSDDPATGRLTINMFLIGS